MALTDGKVISRFGLLWVPMIGGILSVKAIGLSDAFFVARLGTDALAAISFTFPIVMTLISVSIGISAGASSVLSRAIGKSRDDDTVLAIVSGALALSVLAAVVLCAAGFLFIEPVLTLMGAEGQRLDLAARYMRIWFAGVGFLILPVVANGLLRATGDGKTPAIVMGATAVVNIGLNPLFIFDIGLGEGFGMVGAAFATVTARAGATVAILFILWQRGLLKLSIDRVKKGIAHWAEVSRIGLPAAVSTSANPIALSVLTAAVATLGPASVAAYGVATKIQSIAIVPLLALSAAAAPFAGQNSGAGEEDRTRRMLWWAAGISGVWSVISGVILFLFARPFAAAFVNGGETAQDDLVTYLQIVPVSYAGYGAIIALSAACNGLGRSFFALSLAGGRALLLLAPLGYVGTMVAGFSGMAIGTAVANALGGVVALIVISRSRLSDR